MTGRALRLIAGVGALALVMPAAPAAAQHCTATCELVGCVRDYGGVRCRRRCWRHCYHPPRRYEPRPYAQPPPVYHPTPRVTSAHSANLQLDPLLVALAGGVALITLIGIAAIFAPDPDSTADIDADIAKTNEITARLEAAARDADTHIAAAITKARQGDRHG